MDGPGLSLALVVAAAGRGERFESAVPKQHVPLLGMSLLQRTVTALSACEQVDALLLVVDRDEVDRCRAEFAGARMDKVLAVVAGGAERSLSVRNGLRELARLGLWDLVGVHDGARPLVTCAEVDRAVQLLAAEPDVVGAVSAFPCVDTIKVVDDEGRVTGTPDRRSLWQAQTPQIFRWSALMQAYEQPEEVLLSATDDSALVEMAGGCVKLVEGSRENLKITDRADLRHAERIITERSLP